ncbi:MAG: choice-of-anchor L domain-containing protein [Bacteroidota bacterium]
MKRVRHIKNLFVLILLLFPYSGIRAQLVVQNNLTPEQLVQQVLVGGGVAVSNVTYQGHIMMRGSFTNGHATNLGLDEGVILSSGNVYEANGISTYNASTGYGQPGDPTLTQVSGFNTNDASVLEFDFVPTADTLRFKYVFGSEEYPEYVYSFNDSFGFFVSGPKPNGLGNYVDYNVALVPGTNLPVTINNVNNGTSNTGPCVNCAYYVNNSTGTTIVYDAFTTVLTATLVVIPCEQYHIKLAIADAVDAIYDSGVFLEANSFSSSGPSTNMSFSNSSNGFGAAVEACNDAQLTFMLDEMRNEDYYIVRQQTIGTATLDVDYALSPSEDTLWIPAGELSVTLDIFPFSDDLVEGTETADFIFEFAEGCDPTADTTVITILDNTTAIPSFGLQNEFCLDSDPVELLGAPPGGVFTGPGVVGNMFYPDQANSGLNEIYYTIYYIDVTPFGIDTFCINDVMNEAWVYGNPDVYAGPDAIIAEGQTHTLEATAHNYEFVEWSTSGSGTFDDISLVTPVYTPSGGDLAAGSVNLSMYAEAHSPCEGDSTDFMVLSMVSGTTALAGEDDAICEGNQYQLNGTALFYSSILWTSDGDGAFSDPGILDPIYTPGTNDILNGGVTLSMTAIGSSTHSDDLYLSIGPKPVIDLGPDLYIPHGIWINLSSDISGGSGNFTYTWEPASMLVDPTYPNPQTINIYENTTFSLYVTDLDTDCESELYSVEVIIDGAPLGAVPYAEPAVSCAGNNVQLFANPLGGSGSYEYFVWTGPGGETYGFENPIVSITEPSTFTLAFSDGYNNMSASLFIDLLPNPEVDLGGDVMVYCIYEEVILNAGNPGSEYMWSTGDSTQQISLVTTGLAYDEQIITVDVVNEFGCTGTATSTIVFDFDACVGIDEAYDGSNFRIYPNPSYGLFNVEIDGLGGETLISVFNVNGLEVFQETIHLNGNVFHDELNLSSFGKGMYYIRFLNSGFQHIEKLVVY